MATLAAHLQKELFNLTGKDYGYVISKASEIYGTISGAYAYYQAGRSLLEGLGFLDSPANPLDEINEKLAEIEKILYDILEKIDRTRLELMFVEKHLTRISISNDASDINDAAYNAYACLKFPGGHDCGTMDYHRSHAQNCINHFKDDSENYWTHIYLEQLNYKDEWSGTLAPPTDGEMVWDFVAALPAYLFALANWCIVVLASDDGFKEAHLTGGTEIDKHIDKLHSVLCQILASFEPIKVPTFEMMQYLSFAITNDNFYSLHFGNREEKIYFPQEAVNELLRFLPGGKWRLAGYCCGIVEKYTGWSILCAFPTEEIRQATAWLHFAGSFCVAPDGSPESLFTPTGAGAIVTITNQDEYQKFYDRFLLRHTIRTWEQGRKLSAKLGLLAVRKCITDLCTMRNIAPPALPPEWNRYVMMSMRELWLAVPDSFRNSSGQTGIGSMRKLAEFAGVQKPIALRRIFFLDAEN